MIVLLTIPAVLCAGQTVTIVADSTSLEQPEKISWMRSDHARHFVGGLYATLFMANLNNRFLDVEKKQSRQMAAGFTLTLALGKEWLDSGRPGNTFSWSDLGAGAAGVAVAIILLGLN